MWHLVLFCIIKLVTLSSQDQYYANNSSLKLVQILFRHGERSPTETYENDPYKDYDWPGGLGLLNNRGKWEMYNLGLQLRQYYSNYLPSYYYPPEVKVYSSYSDRCLVSAELLLAGLFPPVGEQIWNPDLLWQPIPVNYNPRNLDNIIAMRHPCAKYDQAFKELENKKINETHSRYPGLYQYLNEHTGSTMETIIDIEFLYNTLEIEELNDLKLPEWTKRYYPEPMRTIAAESLALFSENTLLKRLSGGVFLKNITTNMNQTINEETKRVLFLYSGHDITIVNVMRSLGFNNLLKPDFAATLIFELHNSTSDYEVKILYKKNVTESIYELNIPNCDAPCYFNNLLEALQPVLPADWNKECEDV